ncbi:MAG: OmpA family protein [Alphaproteobacteria bacterium]|nr:OmpA family protein [Alphaproteobacteria bacterium]
MKIFKLLGVIAMAGILVSCTTSLQKVRTVKPTGGTPFTANLTEEYRQYANFESRSEYDWVDARHFARKGLAAAEGQVVLPEELGNWDLPADKVDELAQARSRLMTALDGGGREKGPDLAARAQSRFDCWVEQQEENHQPDDINSCRTEFLEAMVALEALLAPPPVAVVAPAEFIVYFEFDKSRLTTAGKGVISEVLNYVNGLGSKAVPQISVTGHTDLAGPAAYNMALSLRRADTVRKALIAGGVPAEAITTAGRGEAEPAVRTKDGTPERKNRRAIIIVQ